MNKTRGFSKHCIWPFNRMAFSDDDYSPSRGTNQNNNTQEPAAHTPYSCEEFLRASVSSLVTPNAPRRYCYCTWAHMTRGYKAIKQSFREWNKRQELERRKSRIYTITLENTRIKMANHENVMQKSSPVTGLEWPRGFQKVKVPRFHDNGTGRW